MESKGLIQGQDGDYRIDIRKGQRVKSRYKDRMRLRGDTWVGWRVNGRYKDRMESKGFIQGQDGK